ncbi:hypothetical protein Lal_00012422 [Lupinus albus]|nr:hypothetical protein Lal_00012422 [Lupinus albus]
MPLFSPRRDNSRSGEATLAQARILQYSPGFHSPIFICMTRRNTYFSHPINPEIDITYYRLVRQNMTLPLDNQSFDRVSIVDTHIDSASISVHSTAYSDFVHSVAYSDYVHYENMVQPHTPQGPRERTLRELVAPTFTYDIFCIKYPPRTGDHPKAYAVEIYDPSSSKYNPDVVSRLQLSTLSYRGTNEEIEQTVCTRFKAEFPIFDKFESVIGILNSWKPRLSERFSSERERITWEGEILGYTGGFSPERELSRLGEKWKFWAVDTM